MLFNEAPLAASAEVDHTYRNYPFGPPLLLVNAAQWPFHLRRLDNPRPGPTCTTFGRPVEREQQLRSLPTAVQHAFQRSDDTARCSTPTRVRHCSAVTTSAAV